MSGPLYLQAQREKNSRGLPANAGLPPLGHGAKNGRYEETCIRDDSRILTPWPKPGPWSEPRYLSIWMGRCEVALAVKVQPTSSGR